jgi:hypothetical protein
LNSNGNKWISFIILCSLSFAVKADNIYLSGTTGYELAAYAEKVLQKGVSPYFVMAKDPAFFKGQYSSKINTKLSKKSLNVLETKNWKASSRVVAFTKYTDLVPETESRSVCVVVFVDSQRAVIGSTLMHELMHCRIGAAELNNGYRTQIVRAGTLDPAIPGGSQLTMFEEVLARALSLTFLVNDGLKEDGDFFLHRVSQAYPSNPGPKSVPRAMKICIEKGACSTDVGVLAKRLLDDPEFVANFKVDMKAAYQYNIATGFETE